MMPHARLRQRAMAHLRYQAVVLGTPPLRGMHLRLGPGFHAEIASGAEIAIGRGFVARPDLTLIASGTLAIGTGCFCNRGVQIAAMDHITIGDGVRLGERVSVIDHDHVLEPLDDHRARFEDYDTAEIVIGSRVLVGANSVILAGAQIGDDTVIAAGSIVRGVIPPGVLAAGAPAAVKRELRKSA